MSIHVQDDRKRVRAAWWLAPAALSALCLAFAVVFFAGTSQFELAGRLSNTAVPVFSTLTGTAIGVAAFRFSQGRARLAWSLIGASVFAWGIGETVWAWYVVVVNVEVPYPGAADIFYLSGYPLMFAGILLLPHVRAVRFERLRITLDTLAGSVALMAILWSLYLKNLLYWEEAESVAYNLINNAYAFGDVFLLLAVMFIATRRSEFRFDIRLMSVASALGFMTAADIIYTYRFDEYVSGHWLDGLWLVSYGLFAITAALFVLPLRRREPVQRRARWWELAVPYAAILSLFVLASQSFFGKTSAEESVLELNAVLVGFLIVVRQWVAIRENREIVEKERFDLVASISHELRTPLTAVSGFTHMMREEWDALDPGTRHEMIEIVDEQAQHLTRIVTDLVELARGRLSTTKLDLQELELGEVIRDAVAMVLPLSATDPGPGIEVAEDMRITADRGRLLQVLVNLLSNADRYGNGRVLVRAFEDQRMVYFEVHDNGPGVPRRYHELIWERFERGEHRFDSRKPGSGIGLTIAKALCEAHGGEIEYAQSELLGGACFRASLPRLRVRVAR